MFWKKNRNDMTLLCRFSDDGVGGEIQECKVLKETEHAFQIERKTVMPWSFLGTIGPRVVTDRLWLTKEDNRIIDVIKPEPS